MPLNRPHKTPIDVRRLALTAMLFAASLVLSYVESFLPLPIYGIRLGLSNIPVMYVLFFCSRRQALSIAVLKAGFIALVRGAIAGLLSLSGGLLSLAVMVLLLAITRRRASVIILSVCGAVAHNAGQLAAASLIYTNLYTWTLFPVLLAAGVAAGVVTALILRFILPALDKLGLNKNK